MHDYHCRICGAGDTVPILSLGETPLANALLTADELDRPEPRFPLDLVFCPACTLLQITETVPPEQLFGEYLYFSSFSDAMVRHAELLAEELIARRGLDGGCLVVEVASNDGYLLQHYLRAGVPVLGVEPARNVAAVAEERGVPTRCAFFGSGVAAELAAEGRRADVIHALNVLAHVAGTNDVVAGMAALLKPDGVVVMETAYVKPMLDGVEFDQIYHEHLCYFSLTSLAHLFGRHGLSILDVEQVPTHGGSLRVTAGLRGTATPRVAELLAEEDAWGVDRPAPYLALRESTERLRADLRSLLANLKADGKRIAAYGASAKGTTLLNYFGIGAETVDFVVDRSTVKQGRFTPGTHLPISPPERLLEDRPDHVLLLTWNFVDEILAQQTEYRAGGGRFIVPIPDLRVV